VAAGVIASDGSSYVVGQGGEPINEQSGAAVFSSDGHLKALLGSPLLKLNVPDPAALLGEVTGGQPVVLGRDGLIYFLPGPGIEAIDSNLDLVKFPLLYVSTGVVAADYVAVDKSSNLYLLSSVPGQQASIQVFDLNGNFLKTLAPLLPVGTIAVGIGIADSGDIILVSSDQVTSFAFQMYDSGGNLLQSVPIVTSGLLRNFVQDSQGRFAVFDGVTVTVFDQTLNQVLQLTSSDPSFVGGAGLLGLDGQSNVYMGDGGGLLKFDQNGNRIWASAFADGSQSPVFRSPFLVASTPSVLSDPISGDVLVLNSAYVDLFSNGVFLSQFRGPGKVSLSIDSAGELYFPVYDGNAQTSSISVTDLTGNVLRTISIPGYGHASGIAVDASDNKYLMDIANATVLELDAADNFVGSLKLNAPSGQSFDSGAIAVSPDGTLVLNLGSLVNVGSSTPSSLVKKVKLDGTEVWSNAITSDYSRVHNVAVDNQGLIYVLREQALEVWDANGNKLRQVDLAMNGSDGVELVGLSAANGQIYMYQAGRVFVLASQ
jgi:sugar lactone lactonase YvrE